MIFDSAMLAAIAVELQPLVGTRLREVWIGGRPGADSSEQIARLADGQAGRALCLGFGAATVLIDTHPQRAMVHLSRYQHQHHQQARGAAAAGPFLEAVRRHLRGASLTALGQPHFDRVLQLSFSGRDAVGRLNHYTLIAEIMERRSNIVLLDADGQIIDALVRLPPFLNRVRTILPHRPYVAPPAPPTDPRTIDNWPLFLADMPTVPQTPDAAEAAGVAPAAALVKWLRTRVTGISPPAALFVTNALQNGDAASACAAYFAQVQALGQGRGTAGAFLCGEQPYPFAIAANCRPSAESLSSLLEARMAADESAQATTNLRSGLLGHLARLRTRLEGQRADVDAALTQAREAESFKHLGQLILANIGAVESAAARGATFIDLDDPWCASSGGDEDNIGVQRVIIEPKWSAADNAARYFGRYKRAARLAQSTPRRQGEIESAAAALAQWEAAAAAAADHEGLSAVAVAAGWAPPPPRVVSRTRVLAEAARPENKLRHQVMGGYTVYMGRNALENQLLLSKLASPSDIWMHVRGMPSAHVVIKTRKGVPTPPAVLADAGRWLAAAGRTGRQSPGSVVELIYTPAKWVRAVKGAPGRVTLGRFETLDVRLL